MIKPESLCTLRPSSGKMGNEPHKQKLCEMCQKHDKKCKDPLFEEEQSDVESVMLENSLTASDDDEDDGVTSVGSNVEDQEELAKKFASFKLNLK